jgi:nicotinamide mononucleotide transporter
VNVETVAVVLAVVYLLLAIRQNIWCWAAALVSTALFLVVFFDARLYMESALQVFYIAMAVYGWHQWRRGDHGSPRRVTSWTLTQHARVVAAIVALAGLSSFLLTRYTDAAMPFVDSLTTWGGVVATFMVTRKVLENWHYWFVIDSLSIYLYLQRGLTQTAVLFALYLVLIAIGYVAWRKDLLAQQGRTTAQA